MRIGRDVYVGVSGRTNGDGVRQLTELIAPYGYRVHTVETQGCLHLKSAVTSLRDDLLVVNPQWLDARWFPGMQWIAVDPAEPFAANVLRIGDSLLCDASMPKTRARLEGSGLTVRTVDMSELAKAEGGMTCCSLICLTSRFSVLGSRFSVRGCVVAAFVIANVTIEDPVRYQDYKRMVRERWRRSVADSSPGVDRLTCSKGVEKPESAGNPGVPVGRAGACVVEFSGVR